MKRTNRWLSLLLSMIMLIGVICISPASVTAATTPSKVSNSEAYNKIYTLYSVLGEGSYFTTTHSNNCGSKSSGHACSYCKVSSILNKSWFINKFGTLSVSQFPSTYYSDGKAHGPDGWSCFGFASFAEWYVFHTNQSDKVTTSYVGTYSYDYANAQKYIKTGDLIRVDDGHSAIAISCNSTGVEVLDSNWSGSYNCQVYIHTIKYTSKNKVSISRATNSEASSINNTDTIYSSTNPDDYTYPDPDTTDTIYRTSPTMKGSTVAWVQAVLYQLGYSIEVDGSFGQNSEAVIKQFQSDNGLEVDGRVGPATKRKLLERWNEKKHTHSYSVYAESTHPHKEYNKCSCGDIQYTGQVYASWENTGYESAHPHKSYRTCWCGYKEYTGEYKTVYTCDSCLPEKSVLTVVPGTSLDYTSFSWNSASGADYYELIVYNKNDMTTPVEWLYYVPSNHYKMPLPQGDYVAYVASINSALVNSSCWWVYSDKVNFSVSSAGIFAPVASAEYNGNRYEMFDINLPWEVAKAACEELGGHLVTVSSDSELAVIKELSGQGNYTLYWLGITDKDEEGTWKNVTGDAVSYSNWRTGYPDNDNGEEHYGVLLSDGTWGDVSNMYPSTVGFICEYEGDVEDAFVLGDVNIDGNVNIKDATSIQKHIANLIALSDEGYDVADVDGSGYVNIRDATTIQKHIAGIKTGYPIGKTVE